MMYGYGNMISPSNRLFGGGGANPLWDGLKSYHTMDSTPNDSVGSANFTLYNGATYSAGIINNGFDFDGANDYAEHTTDIGVTGDMTVSLWVYRDVVKTASVWETGDLGTGGMSISLSGASIQIFTYDGSTYKSQIAGIGITTATWTHIGITWDETTKRLDTYVDGVLNNGTLTDFSGFSNTAITSGVVMGRRLGFQYFDGKTDECGVWNRKLTADEFLELYNGGLGLQYTV